MDIETQTILDNLRSLEGDLRYSALSAIIELTDAPVNWAYGVWDELVATLHHKDAHQRAIAAQLLCNLAKVELVATEHNSAYRQKYGSLWRRA